MDDIDEEAAGRERTEALRQERRRKRETLRASWEAQLDSLVDAYIESHANGGPQYSAVSAPAARPCTCDGAKVQRTVVLFT